MTHLMNYYLRNKLSLSYMGAIAQNQELGKVAKE